MSKEEKEKRRERGKISYHKNKKMQDEKAKARRKRLKNEIREKKAEQRFRFGEMERRRIFKMPISSVYGINIQSKGSLENPVFIWKYNGRRFQENLLSPLPTW